MLKLEKRSSHSSVVLCWRDKESFFNSRLLQAFAVALIFHAAGFLVFHVTPFYLPSTFVFPPIQVQSDPFEPKTTAWMVPADEDDDVLGSPPSLWMMDVDRQITMPHSILVPSVNLNLAAFDSLEERFWPLESPPLSAALEEPIMRMTMTGDLVEEDLRDADPLLYQTQPLSFTFPVFVVYQVKLDEQTGEVFWYERIESSQIESVDRLTERVLLSLRFSPHPDEVGRGGVLRFAVFTRELQHPPSIEKISLLVY